MEFLSTVRSDAYSCVLLRTRREWCGDWVEQGTVYMLAGHLHPHASMHSLTCSRLPCLLYVGLDMYFWQVQEYCQAKTKTRRADGLFAAPHAMPCHVIHSSSHCRRLLCGLRCRQPSDDTWQAEYDSCHSRDPPCRDTPGGLPRSLVTLLTCAA